MNIPGVDKNEIEEGAEEVCRYESLQRLRYRQNEPTVTQVGNL